MSALAGELALGSEGNVRGLEKHLDKPVDDGIVAADASFQLLRPGRSGSLFRR